MVTKYIKLSKGKPERAFLVEPAKLLREGGLVAFPTETVYGLGANALDANAIAGIFAAKGRPSDNPLIVHIADSKVMKELAYEITPNIQVLMDKYWPGPLTIVVKRTSVVPDITTGGLATVAVRLPDSQIACELISLAGIPIAAPSANIFGRPSPTCAEDVLKELGGKFGYVIDGGPSEIGLESTIIDCTTPVPTLLRPGGITLEMLIETLGEVKIDKALLGEECLPKAPGMKYQHYAPAAPMILFEGCNTAIAVNAKIKALVAEGKRVGAVISEETAQEIDTTAILAIYGSRLHPAKIAAKLYTVLRSFDSKSVDIIVAEGIGETGIGLAVMNRLKKAAGYNIIKC